MKQALQQALAFLEFHSKLWNGYGEHPQTIAQSIRKALHKTTWNPVSEPPELVNGPYGWPSSVPVLVIEGKTHRVMTYEQIDEDCKPQWFTKCAERWDLTSTVTHWMPLPEFNGK